LAAAGCNIIVDDVNFPTEGVFEDDLVSHAISTVAAQGVLYFSAAGNVGRYDAGTSGTWEGDFVNSGTQIGAISNIQPGTIHSFSGQNSNLITRDTGPISLKWSDPLGGSANDYDLFILNSSLTAVLAASTSTQDGVEDPYESVGAQPAGSRIVIVN